MSLISEGKFGEWCMNLCEKLKNLCNLNFKIIQNLICFEMIEKYFSFIVNSFFDIMNLMFEI